jgi:hypothetical protein
MTPAQVVAAAAVQTFPAVTVSTPAGPLPLAVVMTAIAGAETGGTWDLYATGDPCAAYPDLPCCAGGTSFGPWQIHTVHADYLQRVTGSADPCVWRQWLAVPANSARAAYAVYRGPGGLNNWTSYTNGSWQRYVAAAQAAVRAVTGAVGPGESGPPGGAALPRALWPPLVVAGAAVLLLGGAVLLTSQGGMTRAVGR